MSNGVGGCVYILTNVSHSALDMDSSADLYSLTVQQVEKHFPESFTSNCNGYKLVCFCASKT